jgi:Na+-driven multidrug efflux pump
MCRGVAGAAWATLGSQCVAVLLLTRALMRNSKTSRTLQESHDEPRPPALQVGWYGLPTLEVLGPFMSLASPLIMRCALGMVRDFHLTVCYPMTTVWADG